MEDQAIDIAVLKQQVKDLLDWRNNFVEMLMRRLESLEKEVRDALMGRPTWSTLILITLLSSAVVGLAVNTFKP